MENLTYSKIRDYNLPNLILLKDERDLSYGKYGRMRLRYLEQYRRITWINLLTSCKLQEHLHDIDVKCSEMVAEIVESLLKIIMLIITLNSLIKWLG